MLALLADVHANLEALRGCLAHAGERGARRFAFLGDLVGYGADPGAVLEIVAEHAERGAIVVRGNHDEAAARSGARDYYNEEAALAIEWTRAQLSPEQRGYLGLLPLIARERDSCFVHASAAAPARWEYVDSAGAAARSAAAAGRTYTFCGHVHRQMLYGIGPEGRTVAFRPHAGVAIPVPAHRAWLAMSGSVGQPRDGDPRAAYAIADLEALTITFHRVAYDNLAAAAKIRGAGLPGSIAHRVERGM